MKVVINAASAKMGGAASYIANLLRQLSAEGDGNEFVVFLPPETAAKLGELAPHVRVFPTRIGHAGMLRRLWWEQVTLRRFLKSQKADTLYSTANFAMFFCPVRQVLLVRNALYFSAVYREMFLPRHGPGYRVAFALRRWLIVRSARAADVVMTPTSTMLEELRRSVDVKAAVVNPYGVALNQKQLTQRRQGAKQITNDELRIIGTWRDLERRDASRGTPATPPDPLWSASSNTGSAENLSVLRVGAFQPTENTERGMLQDAQQKHQEEVRQNYRSAKMLGSAVIPQGANFSIERADGAGNRVVRLLYVSLYSEHKNLTTLLKALEILNAGGGTKFKLITTADPAWHGAAWTVTHREDIRLAQRPGIAEWVEFTGPLSTEDVADLYAAADVVVFPSLEESFGFPMAEAMAHGLPVAAADTPVNREVCGRAAVYFSPLSAEELAGRLRSLAVDSGLCRRLGARGRKEAAARFCWKAHARRMMEAARCGRPATLRGYVRAVSFASGMKPPKAPVSVMVLTRNEEANIAACLESVRWAEEVFVVDSFSSDRTAEIAEQLGAKVCLHAFGGYAAQRNWALDHLPFSNDWVLMLDADERAPAELAAEIARVARDPATSQAGFYLKFRHIFLGRWLKHGGLYPTWVLRLFRRRHVRFEERPMNEHAILDGAAGWLQQPFDHEDRKPLAGWVARHNRYAGLEAEEFLQETAGGGYRSSIGMRFRGIQAERKRWIKLKIWNRLPLLLRPFLFFFRNYFLKLGFLDGRPGFIYHVLWSFWYPFLVSAKILERRLEGPQRAPHRIGLQEAAPLAAPSGAARQGHKVHASASSASLNSGFHHAL